MRALALCIAGVSLLILAACIPTSLHPFYTEEDVIFEPALIGQWTEEDEESTLAFEQQSDNSYTVIVDDDGKDSRFEGYLFHIGDAKFLDLFPLEPDAELGEFYAIHLAPLHSILRVEQIDPTLHLSSLDYEWLEQYIEEHPDAIDHALVDGRLIFCAPTDKLQAFVKEHVDTEEAFSAPEEFIKVDE